jgi:peroxiredoxin
MKLITLLLMLGSSLPGLACLSQPIQGTDLKTGTSVSLAPQKNHPVVAVFLSPECPCSRSHEKTLNKLAKKFPQAKFIGIHANSNEPLDESKKYFSQAPLSFPVIRDSNAKLANELGALRTPHVFVIGRDNECLYRGGVDDSHTTENAETAHLENALIDIAAGKKPRNPSTRVLGCMIERS